VFEEADPIRRYTRADTMRDGVLMDGLLKAGSDCGIAWNVTSLRSTARVAAEGEGGEEVPDEVRPQLGHDPGRQAGNRAEVIL
jgi:hypothetical protein